MFSHALMEQDGSHRESHVLSGKSRFLGDRTDGLELDEHTMKKNEKASHGFLREFRRRYAIVNEPPYRRDCGLLCYETSSLVLFQNSVKSGAGAPKRFERADRSGPSGLHRQDPSGSGEDAARQVLGGGRDRAPVPVQERYPIQRPGVYFPEAVRHGDPLDALHALEDPYVQDDLLAFLEGDLLISEHSERAPSFSLTMVSGISRDAMAVPSKA